MTRSAAVQPVVQPLVAAHRGADTVVVRFRMAAARSVASPATGMPGGRRACARWETTLGGGAAPPAGEYYFNW